MKFNSRYNTLFTIVTIGFVLASYIAMYEVYQSIFIKENDFRVTKQYNSYPQEEKIVDFENLLWVIQINNTQLTFYMNGTMSKTKDKLIFRDNKNGNYVISFA